MKNTKNYKLVPVKEDCTLALPHFPTRMQAFIFRAWEMVDVKRIAKVLRTTEETVRELAFDMGLPPQKNTEEWLKKGYITIIRSLWHILSYEQLLELLEWEAERLAYSLKEDDLLNKKLGNFKPACDPIYYAPLTEEEKKITQRIRDALAPHTAPMDGERLPFDYLTPIYPTQKREATEAKPDEVLLNDQWGIVCDSVDEQVQTAISIFREAMEEDWGVAIAAQKQNKNIVISLKEGNTEYHKVEICCDQINITAEIPGVLRAMTLLIDEARAAGGPHYSQKTYEREAEFSTRFLYSYCGLYGKPFDEPWQISYPESMLKQYATMGINGIWNQGILQTLVEFPFDTSVSEGWQARLENLKDLVRTAKKYGIKLYLYLNEPRSMPLEFFENYPDMKGHIEGDYACICTTSERGRKYLYDAVKELCSQVPDLGGFFIIARSESLTNCYSRAEKSNITCPRCAKRVGHEVVSEVYQIITEAVQSVNPEIQVMAWPWGWMGESYPPEAVDAGLALLPKEDIVLAVSENEKELNIGGVENEVHDYSMAHIGPSKSTKHIWNLAKKHGHRCFAKLQINTTWECSPCPALPVYQLIIDHLNNVKQENISGLMLSWTLGGYPSANLKVASGSYFRDIAGEKKDNHESILRSIYREDYETVKEATDLFCEGFKEFPFNHGALYRAPHNAGPSNLLYEAPTGYNATMTCYSYDDLDSWRINYPADIFENQYGKICEKWEQGLALIENLPDSEFKDCAYVGYALFKSAYEQIRFTRARNEAPENAMAIMMDAAAKEKELAAMVYRIMRRNPSIGYEAANHYYFNQTMLLEKIVNCDYLLEKYAAK